MGQEWRVSALFFLIGSYLAARPAFGVAGAARAAHEDVSSPAVPDSVDGGTDAETSTLTDSQRSPYEGVARRKSSASPASQWYPPSVLRPKPADSDPGES